MKNFAGIFMVILKIILGIIFGLFLSLVTIVGLEFALPDPNPFRKETVNLWLIAPIIAGWLFLMLWLMLRKWSSGKIETSGIDHLPESVSELIDAVIEAMRYRKGARTEVRQELTDHFTDALADCTNEQEKKERIKTLIEDFGNVELLGTLIRRGKKRCQPFWLKVLTHIPHAIGVLILLLVLYIGWFFTGKPQITTNYINVFNEQVRPEVAESQNAWPFYEQAVKNYVKPNAIDPKTESFVTEDSEDSQQASGQEELINLDVSPQPLKNLSQEEYRILVQWLADNRQALELIREGNQKPYCWRTYSCEDETQTEMIAILMPSLSELKKLTCLLCWRGLIDANLGDFDQSCDSFLESYSLGQHIRGQNTTLIEQLVSMAIESLSTNTLRICLSEHTDQTDAKTISRIRQQFETMTVSEHFSANFHSEKLFLYDEVQRCFTESRFGKSHLYLPRLAELGAGPHEEAGLLFEHGFSILFTQPDKEETLKAVNTFYAEMDALALQTPATLHAQGFDFESYCNKTIQGNMLLEILLPALSKVIELSYRNAINSHATLAVLALIEYQKEFGRFPDSLETLVEKDLLQRVPIDPFSNQPLVYRKTDTGFTLYSVGSNFTDDGGVPATDDEGKPRQWGNHGDWIFWPQSD